LFIYNKGLILWYLSLTRHIVYLALVPITTISCFVLEK
jgi:hypothetical protein